MKFETIQDGKNIILRNISLTDCSEKYVNWLNNKEINEYLESRLTVQTEESVRQFVSNIIESDDTYLFAILSKENNEHIGNIKVGPINFNYKHTFIGYLIGDKEHWGKGIASEAVYLAVKFCHNILKLHKINAGIIAENIGSIRVLEKLGFKMEGCIRDDVFINGKYSDVYKYGLLETELVSPYNN